MSEVFNCNYGQGSGLKIGCLAFPFIIDTITLQWTSAIQRNAVTCVRVVIGLRDSIQTNVLSVLLGPPAADGKLGLLPSCLCVVTL